MAKDKNTKPARKNLAGCVQVVVYLAIGLIAAAQAAGGIVAFAVVFLQINEPKNWENVVGAAIAAALFGSVGFGLITALVVDWRRKRGRSAPAAPADQPWLSRADWASGRIEASGGSSTWTLVQAVVAAWWILVSLPLVAVLPSALRAGDRPIAAVAVAIPLVGMAIIAGLVYHLVRAQKFGQSIFELRDLPGLVGGQLAGTVWIPRRVHPLEGFRVRLLCVEWVTHHGQKRDRKIDQVIWQDERLVMDPITEGINTGVPALFAIPFELPQTSRPESEREVEWRLEVWARLPGIDYDATFDVPVFKTAESQRDFRLVEEMLPKCAPPDNEFVLGEAGIVREPVGTRGVRLTFKAARNWRTALVVSLFLVLAGGVAAFLLVVNGDEVRDFFNIPGLWHRVVNDFGVMNLAAAVFRTFLVAVCGAIFALVMVAFLLVSLDLWLYRSVVEASPDGLTIHGGWLGFGRTHRVAAEDIRQFKAEEYMHSSGGGVWKSVVVVPRRGRGEKLTIGKGIGSKLAQDAVINELNAALGRQTD
jgi:hypothetical protein